MRVTPRTRLVALASVAVSGVASLVMATPAHATTVTQPVTDPACATVADQSVLSGGAPLWVGHCIPQYGLGKAEFQIASDADLPPGFDLATATLSYDSGIDVSAAEHYFGIAAGDSFPLGPAPFKSIAFASPYLVPDSTQPRSQKYYATYPVAVAALDELTLEGTESFIPTDTAFLQSCGDNLVTTPVLRVTYTPVTMTFTEVVDSQTWSVALSVTPTPLYLSIGGSSTSCVWSGSAWQDFAGDAGAPLGSTERATLGIYSLVVNVTGVNGHPFTIPVGTDLNNSGFGPDGFLGFANLGTFPLSNLPVPDPPAIPVPAVDPPADPPAALTELALTGQDPSDLLIFGGVGFLAVAAGVLLVLRRRLSR